MRIGSFNVSRYLQALKHGNKLRRIFGPKREELMRGLRKFAHMVGCSVAKEG
jgi:hypothetical protein